MKSALNQNSSPFLYQIQSSIYKIQQINLINCLQMHSIKVILIFGQPDKFWYFIMSIIIMMEQVTKDYLALYNDLSDPVKSSSANQALIKIQRNSQSWELARQLLMFPNSEPAYIHGCQLLSKKLNRAYTFEDQKRLNLFNLIYSRSALNETLFYCLAKLCLHLDLPQISMLEPYCNAHTLISILSWIPEAAKMITVAPLIQKTQDGEKVKQNRQYNLAKSYFQKYVQILIQYFSTNPQKSIECIQNYVTNGFKIKQPSIIRLLLSQKIDKISSILETVLGQQQFPQLNQEIYQYLLNCGLDEHKPIQEMQDIFLVYISFCSNIQLLDLTSEFLIQILTRVIQFMKRQINQSQNSYVMMDASFKFWSYLITLLKEAQQNQNKKAQIQITQQALIQVWKILIEKSKLKELPEFIRQEIDPLVISLDDDDDQDGLQIKAKVSIVGKFRTLAQDYILLIYNSLVNSQAVRTEGLRLIYEHTLTGDPINLQLSIFVISCIIESSKSDGIQAIGQIIQSIISHQHAKIPYIWQQLIKLMSKFGSQATSNLKVTRLSLLVLKQSLKINELCTLSSQTFYSILNACQQSSQKQSLTPYFQSFINQIYESVYLKLIEEIFVSQKKQLKYYESSFQHLSKAIIIFLYSFKKNPNDFIQYLTSVRNKMEENALKQNDQNLGNQKKIQIICNLVGAHNFLLEQYSSPFTYILSDFVSTYNNLFKYQLMNLANEQYCRNRQKHKKMMNYLNLIIGTISGYNSLVWAQLISQLLLHAANLKIQKQQQWNKTLYRYIHLCVTFFKIKNNDQNQYKAAVPRLFEATYPIIYSSMEKIQIKQNELINQILGYHMYLIEYHLQIIPQFNPQHLYFFIKNNLIDNQKYWQYTGFKTSLAILRLFSSKKYQVPAILEMIISQYQRLSDCLWKSYESVLIQIFKQGGIQIFRQVFNQKYPQLLNSGPLFESFIQALANGGGKQMKLLLETLK